MMRVFQFALGLLVLTAGMLSAREGYVRTRAGVVFDGHLRFESNAVVVVNVGQVFRIEVALTNLAELVFSGNTVDEPLPGGGRAPGTVELPPGWAGEDVGRVETPGEVRRRNELWRVRSSGTNALGTADACHFVFKAVADRGELVARVTGMQRTDPWARAGLMIRESLSPGARHVFASVTAARGGVMSMRERYGEEAQVSLDIGQAAGGWLKLKRDGNQFTAFKSRNGARWTLVERWTMPMAKECYAGVAVTAGSRGGMAEAVFENVEAGVFLRNRWFTPQVELAGGSAKSGHLDSMDDQFVYFETRFGREPLARSAVAQVRFQPLTSRGARELVRGRRGVLLVSGEFVDGECRGIEQGRLVLSSVPLGLVRYDVNSEVTALVLRDRRLGGDGESCELRMTDGSVWRGRDLEIVPLGVRLREPSLGWQSLPLHEISELRFQPRD